MSGITLDVCPKYRECKLKNLDLDCFECNSYQCYLLGFSEGANRAVHAMNTVEPLLNNSTLDRLKREAADDAKRLR